MDKETAKTIGEFIGATIVVSIGIAAIVLMAKFLIFVFTW